MSSYETADMGISDISDTLFFNTKTVSQSQNVRVGVSKSYLNMSENRD